MTWSHENSTIIRFSHRPFLRLKSKISHNGCITRFNRLNIRKSVNLNNAPQLRIYHVPCIYFLCSELLDVFYYIIVVGHSYPGNRILIRTSTNAVQMTLLISVVVCMDFSPFTDCLSAKVCTNLRRFFSKKY